jgi:hypothetical protein
MEGLIQLVAATFIRHGIESPNVADSQISQAIPSAEVTLPTALPEHDCRGESQAQSAAP